MKCTRCFLPDEKERLADFSNSIYIFKLQCIMVSKGCFGIMVFPCTERRRLWLSRVLILGLIAFVLFEAFSFVCWLLLPLFPSSLNPDGKGIISAFLDTEAWLFFSSAGVAPIFALLWMFSWTIWPFRVFLRFLRGRIHWSSKVGKTNVFLNKFAETLRLAVDKAFKPVDSGLNPRILMVASLALVILVAVYPYLPSLNPHGKFVGVDIPFYEKHLMELDSLGDFGGVVHKVFFPPFSDRPLSLLFLFSGWKLTWFSARQTVQFSPILLGLLLVLATYFFVRQAEFNRLSASFAMLFTVFSYHITVGMYGGLIANWISLVFLYVFLGFVFASLKKVSWRLFGVALAFQSFLLFSHANTWGMSMGILGVFFFVLLVECFVKRENSFRPLMLLMILVVGMSLNAIRNFALGISVGTVEVASVAQSGVSLTNLLSVWQTLRVSLGSYMGISFMNPVLLFLASLGGLAMTLNTRLVSRFFTASLVASSIPFFLGDNLVQTRILYDLPVHVFAFLGLLVLLSLAQQFFGGEEAKRIRFLLVLFVIFVCLNYVFRCSFYLTQVNFFPVK